MANKIKPTFFRGLKAICPNLCRGRRDGSAEDPDAVVIRWVEER
jgi:hypothetical protein